VEFARKNGSLIVYDAAYALYIQNPDCPKSIFEIEGEYGASMVLIVARSARCCCPDQPRSRACRISVRTCSQIHVPAQAQAAYHCAALYAAHS
jgi:hypothetical protein